MALRLIRSSGAKAAWTMVACGLIIMAARRGMVLFYIARDTPMSDLVFEILGLAISILMFIGVLLIKPLFDRINRNRDDLVRHQAELQDLNSLLEERVAAALKENLEKDRMMMMRAREAAMGEMIRNIAHQWKQPLNSLALAIQELQYCHLDKTLTDEQMETSANQSMALIQHMSQTIGDFSNFFNPEKASHRFSAEKKVLLAKSFVNASCMKRDISIDLETLEDSTIEGPENELVQVLMNLFQNSAEAFGNQSLNHKNIKVRIFRENGRAVITITDNAGGISPDMLPRLFDIYATTKENGTGIGLYMSKMIITNSFHGELSARNVDGGAEFRIEI